MKTIVIQVAVWFAVIVSGCVNAAASYPECGTNIYSGHYLIPGPGEAGYDAPLDLKARRYERQFHVFNALPMGVNADAAVKRSEAGHRTLIERFINESGGWDFEAFSGGLTAYDVIDGWGKVAGLYAGAGIAADAFRYSTLRDQGADCDEVAMARSFLIRGLDAMHIAFTIGGAPGIVARGFLIKGLPGMAEGIVTTPLFDSNGNPLPPVKNNGTWREDVSGLYPDYIWEDSNSRDQMLGWAMASAVSMEVIRDDPSFPGEIKQRLKKDATDFGRELRKIRASGYDLEFPDADGRTTFHGYLNENNVDGTYLPGLKNGFYAMMSLGIVSAYAYASEDPEAYKYLNEELIEKRGLPQLAVHHMKFIDMGAKSNYSNDNMVFTAAWLALRYVNNDKARAALWKSLDKKLYNLDSPYTRPAEMKQSLFDLIYAASKTGGTAFAPPGDAYDAAALARALETLREFPAPPFWEFRRENCDDSEVQSRQCVLDDGTTVNLLGQVGWTNELVADTPIPMKCRPPSNYYWRSNPYAPNGGAEGDALLPGVDFRVAYWLGRWTRISNG